MTRPYIVSFDFDGTVTLNDDSFPVPGPERPEAIKVLRGFSDDPRIALLLNTCREGAPLEIAVAWLADRQIVLDAVNESLPITKSRTRKPHYDVHICDKNFPRVPESIDWNALDKYVRERLETWSPDEDHPFYANGSKDRNADYAPAKEIADLKAGYEELDKNWEVVHKAAIEHIRVTLGAPVDATIPEMSQMILSLQRRASQYGLNFGTFSKINKARSEEVFFPVDHWSPSEWAVALGGEVGELLNEIKKLNRLAGGTISNIEQRSSDEIKAAIGEEVADVLIYLDLLCQRFNLDLETVLVRKFNKDSSKKVGSSLML